MKYARDTAVSPENSRAEIERTLKRYGAGSFAYASEKARAAVQFEAHGRRVRFIVPIPLRSDFDNNAAGNAMSRKKGDQAWEKSQRQRWRALALAIKAKLEAVETGITTFEEEFLAHIVLPDGGTVGEWLTPQIEHAY